MARCKHAPGKYTIHDACAGSLRQFRLTAPSRLSLNSSCPGYRRKSTITETEDVSYVSSAYVPQCLRYGGRPTLSNAHRAHESGVNTDNIRDELDEVITLNSVSIIVAEYIPFGANQVRVSGFVLQCVSRLGRHGDSGRLSPLLYYWGKQSSPYFNKKAGGQIRSAVTVASNAAKPHRNTPLTASNMPITYVSTHTYTHTQTQTHARVVSSLTLLCFFSFPIQNDRGHRNWFLDR